MHLNHIFHFNSIVYQLVNQKRQLVDIMVFREEDFEQLLAFNIILIKIQVVFNFRIKTMNHSETKPRLAWKKEEDEALKHLKQDLKIQKWTEIAEKLTSLYHISNRNHQQFRDRYVNFLQNNHNSKKWTSDKFQKLIDLYVVYSNKWSEIANHFENINGLLIKNKFYSRLRKGLRNINFLIQTFLSDSWKKLNFNMTFKLINCAANKFDFSEKSPLGKKIEHHITFVQEIVKNVFNISWLDKRELCKAFKSKNIEEDFHRQNIDKLIQDINFIDENLDQKHSNRRFPKQKLMSSNAVNIKSEKSKKSVSSGNNKKLEKDKIMNSSEEQKEIAHDEKKQKVQVITVNSFDRRGQMREDAQENHYFRAFQNPQECAEPRDNIKKIGTRHSGYRQHSLEEVKLQANYGAQQKFFDRQNPYDPRNLKISDAHINQVYFN